MKALIKKEMRLSRTLLFIWMGIVLLLCGFAYFEYLSLRETFGRLEQQGAVVTTTIGMFLTEVVLFALGLLISSLAKTYKNITRLGAGMLLGFYGFMLSLNIWELQFCIT